MKHMEKPRITKIKFFKIFLLLKHSLMAYLSSIVAASPKTVLVLKPTGTW